MRTFRLLVVVVLLLLVVGTWWLKFDHTGPTAELVAAPEVLGRKTPFDVRVIAGSTPLRSSSVRLRPTEGEKKDQIFELASETYPASGVGGGGVRTRQFHIETDLVDLGVPEGPAVIEVDVDSHAWRLWSSVEEPKLTVPVTVDLTAPRIEILSAPHNLRLGGADLAVFRQSPDTVRSGITVGTYYFPSSHGYFSDDGIALAMFAAPQDLTGEIRFYVVAVDAGGNERRVELPANVKLRKFKTDTLAVGDRFLERKVPEIVEVNRLSASGSLIEQYLYINRDLRARNESQIAEITAKSEPRPLWDGPFRRQPNAAPLSSFADRRTYEYQDQVIDHQTHLGYDLASTKLAPVVAAQNGIVVFADNLGIYGNAVILDHGLGVFSLYAHLSTTSVHVGDRVAAGQTIAQTGETGLAGGDHLHFSVMLYGVHIDPIEWWDPHWLEDHVTARLELFPRAPASKADATS